jgi:hypothetical protein
MQVLMQRMTVPVVNLIDYLHGSCRDECRSSVALTLNRSGSFGAADELGRNTGVVA